MDSNVQYPLVDSLETLEAAFARVRRAQAVFATYSQEQVDRIFLAAATAANKARIPLAKMAANRFRASSNSSDARFLNSSCRRASKAYESM